MKLGLNVVGVLITLVGAIWLLQGIGVLQGSFMSNTTQWTLIGILMLVIGGGILIYNYRHRSSS